MDFGFTAVISAISHVGSTGAWRDEAREYLRSRLPHDGAPVGVDHNQGKVGREVRHLAIGDKIRFGDGAARLKAGPERFRLHGCDPGENYRAGVNGRSRGRL